MVGIVLMEKQMLDEDRNDWDCGDWDSFIDEYHCTDYWIDTDSLMDSGCFEETLPQDGDESDDNSDEDEE